MGNALRLLPSKALCITIVAAGRNVLAPYPGIECVVGPRNFAVFHNFHPIQMKLAVSASLTSIVYRISFLLPATRAERVVLVPTRCRYCTKSRTLTSRQDI